MRIIYIPILCLILTSCGTTSLVRPENNYEKIIEIEGLSKDKLYIKANAWFVETFNSAESVIEFQDKEEGKIIGKYASKSYYRDLKYRTVVSVDVQENRVRVKFYDAMVWHEPHGKYMSVETNSGNAQSWRGVYRRLSEDLIPQWKGLANVLESRLNESDDW